MIKNICIVEDNAGIREILSYILEDENFDVKMCGTVKEFNAHLKKALPDVVVLDIMLTDGSGIALCKQMKSTPATSHIPVLLMSAHSRPEEVMELSGADAFISKPFDIDEFKDTVTSYLHK